MNKLHGSDLHHVHTGFFWASQWLTRPPIHAYVHKLIHTYKLLVSAKTVAAVVWPAISTIFIVKSPRQVE